MEKKARNANYELLRIIAMMMVIVLHYLSKGGFLTEFSKPFKGQDYLAWTIEAFCMVAVNVYVLISGYFLAGAKFRMGKIFSFWGQVLIYSVFVPAVLLATGVLVRGDISFERVVTWLFPILREHYWFASVYLFLYLLSPFLGQAAERLEQKTFRHILILLLLLCSGAKSILPLNLALDTGGYDLLWFICLFLIAAYIRRYGLAFLQKGKRGFFVYLISVAGILLLSAGYRMIYLKTGKLGDFYGSAFQYNHLLCLSASLGLFCFFGQIQITGRRITQCILSVASCTFGIYLLHENEAIRNLWQGWFSKAGMIPGLFLSIVFIFTVGILVDQIRQKVFHIMQRRKT